MIELLLLDATLLKECDVKYCLFCLVIQGTYVRTASGVLNLSHWVNKIKRTIIKACESFKLVSEHSFQVRGPYYLDPLILDPLKMTIQFKNYSHF